MVLPIRSRSTRGGLTVRTKGFFDRPEVIRRLSRKRHAVLSRTGAYGRGVMRNLLAKKGPPASAPGEPPRRRVGLIRDLTDFALSPTDDAVVIGPYPIHRSRGVVLHGKASIPQLLDEGGRQTITQPSFSRSVVMRYKPRPFRRPTLEVLVPMYRQFTENTPL